MNNIKLAVTFRGASRERNAMSKNAKPAVSSTVRGEVGLCGRLVTGLDQRAVWFGCRRWRFGFWYRLHESAQRWPLLSGIARMTSGWGWRVWRIAFTFKANDRFHGRGRSGANDD